MRHFSQVQIYLSSLWLVVGWFSQVEMHYSLKKKNIHSIYVDIKSFFFLLEDDWNRTKKASYYIISLWCLITSRLLLEVPTEQTAKQSKEMTSDNSFAIIQNIMSGAQRWLVHRDLFNSKIDTF